MRVIIRSGNTGGDRLTGPGRHSVLPPRGASATLVGAALAFGLAGQAMASTVLAGAVYVGTNDAAGNTIAAFGADTDGTLTPIDTYATGGLGGAFDGGEGLDPLISEDSVLNVDDRFVLTVNAGSNTVSSFRINRDASLSLVSTASTGGVGPNSIAHSGGLVYVSNVDSDGVFTGPGDQSGNITGLNLDPVTGELTPIEGSTRELGNRPSDVEFSPNGGHIVVSSWNAQSAALPTPGANTIVTYGVQGDGDLTSEAVGNAASTLAGNTDGRNLPSVIGFEVVEVGGEQVVIATEAREFFPNGELAPLDQFQTGSVSTWSLNDDGSLTPLSQDVIAGDGVEEGPTGPGGPTSTCWIVVSPDGTVFVSNASGAAISTFQLNDDGTIGLIDEYAAAGTPADPFAANPIADADGFIDLVLGADGDTLYQLLGLQGAVNVYEVGADGSSLSLLQQTSGLLPESNTQGIVFANVAPIPLPAAALSLLTAMGGLAALRRHRRGAGTTALSNGEDSSPR